MAGAVVEYCLLNPSSRIVCIREVQKTLAQSAKLLIEQNPGVGVGSQFRILYDRIETPGVKQRTETQAISNFVLNLFYDPPFETA